MEGDPPTKETLQQKKPPARKSIRCQGQGGEGKHNCCHEYSKNSHFIAECPDKKVITKSTHVCVTNKTLESDFVAKASDLKP
jgi:hypothetical protein